MECRCVLLRSSDGLLLVLFFFQAEDGIRDIGVTGVQTCALPIWSTRRATSPSSTASTARSASTRPGASRSAWRRPANTSTTTRSEERRVGKECRSRGTADQGKKELVVVGIGGMKL